MKNKKIVDIIIVLIICCFMICTIVQGTNNIEINNLKSNTNIKIKFEQPSISKTNINNISFDKISIEGLDNFDNTGKPSLPFKSINIALKPYTKIKTISIKDNYNKINGEFLIKPGDLKTTTNLDITYNETIKKIIEDKQLNTSIYNSDELYPKNSFQLMSVGSYRGINIATIQIYPIKYNPKQKTIYFFKIDNNHSPYNKNDNRLIFKIFSIEIGKTILLN